MNTLPEDQALLSENARGEQALTSTPQSDVEDDFGDEQLGERQPQACSMEDGCTGCQ